MRAIDELFIYLRKMIQSFDLYSKHINKSVGLTGPQLIVLKALERQQGLLTRELAERINLSAATVTQILDRLEDKDLILRQRSTVDKRRVHLSLSEHGREVLAQAPDVIHQDFIQQFDALAPQERSQMLETAEQLAKMLERHEHSSTEKLH